MSVLTDYVQLHQLNDDAVAWRLLRANNAPLILALIGSHFNESTRRIPVVEFVNLVEADLAELNHRLGTTFHRPAQEYCEAWRHEGYLIRRPMSEIRGETYEPSSDALTALGYARRLASPHQTATESRLNLIVDQVSALALAIDPDEERRRSALLQEKAAIDERLAALDRGEFEMMDDAQALEATREILSLAQEIPNDFGRVRSDFESLNRELYEMIITTAEGYANVVDDIFDGYDHITESAQGRSFQSFYRLLQDVDRSESFQDEVDEILRHPAAQSLSVDQRAFLRDFLRIMLRQSHELESVKTTFAHSLRRFVQSRNYLEDRVLRKSIDHSLGLAHQVLAHHKPGKVLDVELNLSNVSLQPVSRLRLMNPFESQAAEVVETESAGTTTVSFEELQAIARLSEIDYAELAANVNACLIDSDLSGSKHPCTVGTVLATYPATQGVASVVGLITLALDQGMAGEGTETLSWISGNRRFQAVVDQLVFTDSLKVG